MFIKEKMTKSVMVGILVMGVVGCIAGNSKAEVDWDGFDSYADGTLLGNSPQGDANWARRGDKNVFHVVNPTGKLKVIKCEVPSPDTPVGNWWKANLCQGKAYQRVSVEFNTGSLGGQKDNPYKGEIRLWLNHDYPNSGYWLTDNGYYLVVRGIKDMWIGRSTKKNGWGTAKADESYYSVFKSDLKANRWYRAIFTKNGPHISAVLETFGGTVIGYATYTETADSLSGGYAGITARWGPDYALDNFKYKLRNHAVKIKPVDYNIAPVTYYNPSTGQKTPFFPVGWYTFGPVGPEKVREIAAAGANVILFADVWDKDAWHYSVVSNALDKAETLGVKIVIGFNGATMLTGIDYNKPKTYAHLKRWIYGFRQHPALLGWQLGDENGGPLTARMVQDAAKAIHNWDPHHQIWQVFSIDHSKPATINYMSNSNVYSLDFYQYFDSLNGSHYTPPFGGSNRLLQNQCIRAAWASEYSWAGNVNVTQAIGADRSSLSHYRFPTYNEYRWNVFSAIAGAKARGTMNWIYYYGSNWYSNPKMFVDFRDNIVKPISLEQRKISRALERGWNVGQLSSNLDNPVEGKNFNKVSYILLHDDITKLYYLIITNNTFNSQNLQLTLSNLPVPLSNLQVRIDSEKKNVLIKYFGNGTYQLSDTLKNHDVKIYTLYCSVKKL